MASSMAGRPAPDWRQSDWSPFDKDRFSLAFLLPNRVARCCNPTRPAPMSGGAAVKAGDGAKGDHPVCTEQRGGRSGKRPGDAPKGSALTARGPQAPFSSEMKFSRRL